MYILGAKLCCTF